MVSVQSSLCIFAQKYRRKCKDTYFILQNKYLRIYEDSFGLMILRDDCASNLVKMWEHCNTECSSKSNWLCHLRWINSAAGNRTIKIIFDQYFGYIQFQLPPPGDATNSNYQEFQFDFNDLDLHWWQNKVQNHLLTIYL